MENNKIIPDGCIGVQMSSTHGEGEKDLGAKNC